MIFVTVGSSYPFDRLIRAVDGIAQQLPEPMFAQIGDGGYEPKHMPFARLLDKEAFDRHLREATMVIGHAGIGTISQVLALDKPLLAVPRLSELGELVNNHQMATAQHFEAGGHVLVARQHDALLPLVERLRSFKPKSRRVQPELVAQRIGNLLRSMGSRR